MFLHVFTGLVLAARVSVAWLWSGHGAVLQLLRNHNILFTKVFQSLANSNNVNISPELRKELLQFTTNTSYQESDIDYEELDRIEQEYGLQIDRHVVNSGMIALVFRATVVANVIKEPTGSDAEETPLLSTTEESAETESKERIIKLKRRGITARLAADCESLRALYDQVAWFAPRNIFIRVLKPFMKNIGDIISQCDFAAEIRNLRQAKEDFAPLDFIKIPTAYNTPSPDPKAIIMEYIDGTHALPPDTPLETRLNYLEQFTTFVSYAYLYNAIQHTDLHSGNVLFRPGGIGIIDYGMAIQVADDMHDVLINMCEITMGKKHLHEVDVIDTFKNLISPPMVPHEINNRAAVEEICYTLAEPLINMIDIDELLIMDLIDNLSAELGHTVTLHRDCYKIILSIAMMGQKVTIMGKDYNDSVTLRELERRAQKRAFALIM
jgi:predicted unusual protein kinase regulating ubiquinone biosynthesis (AarF/ABC1/UbiB family)